MEQILATHGEMDHLDRISVLEIGDLIVLGWDESMADFNNHVRGLGLVYDSQERGNSRTRGNFCIKAIDEDLHEAS